MVTLFTQILAGMLLVTWGKKELIFGLQIILLYLDIALNLYKTNAMLLLDRSNMDYLLVVRVKIGKVNIR